MTDKEKKETLCIFITPSERLGVDENGKNFYKCCGGNEKKYFEKFYKHAVLPLDDADLHLCSNFGLEAMQDPNVKNVQVIFDIHGDDKGLSISEEEMHEILEPIFDSLLDKGFLDNKIEIIMANCQGSLKFNKDGLGDSLPNYLDRMAASYCIKPENISLYCMPKGHGAHIRFNNNGDIFFVSNDAPYQINDYIDNTMVTSLYTKEDQEKGKPNTRVKLKDCVEIQAEKPFDEKGNKIPPVLQGVCKGRPPMKIDISTGKQVPTDLVLYKEPPATTIKHKLDFDLNKKNEITTTIKK